MNETIDTATTVADADRSGGRSRLVRALPSAVEAILGSLAWALLMGASAAFSLWLRDWQTEALIWPVVVLFAAGGGIAFAPGLYAARLFGLGRQREAAFAAGFLCVAVMTIGVTALAFAVYYRSYYAQWHAEIFSVPWTFQLVFTTLGAIAQFAALGVRMYFPFAFVVLLAFSLWFSIRVSASAR